MRRFPNSFRALAPAGRRLAVGACVASVLAGAASGAVLSPDAITVRTPGGLVVSSGTFTDDVFLEGLSFGDVSFTGRSDFRALSRFEVTSGRENVNAEWGDDDTSRDGDADPFTTAGFDPVLQESTSPEVQDRTMLEAFNSRSLTEMMDGEETGGFSYKALFASGIRDNDSGLDDVPELVFIERGMNDVFDVELIIGGTFDNPVFSDTLRFSSADFWDSGIAVDTTEIGRAQTLGIGGVDLSAFGLGAEDTAFGFMLTRVSGGPDMSGFFLSSADGGFQDPLDQPSPIPLPAGFPLLLAGLGGLWLVRRKPA